MAKNLRSWFIQNDIKFGMSIRNLEPIEQGRAICSKYNIDFDEMFNSKDPEKFILDYLNERGN